VLDQTAEPYSEHGDGISALVAEENREGVVEDQENHQLELDVSESERYCPALGRTEGTHLSPAPLTFIAIMRQQITPVGVEAWRSYS